MNRIRYVFYAILCVGVVLAQQPLTNDSVLKLSKAGMGDETIVSMINTQPASFSLNTDDMIALKSGGVSEKVIGAMLLKNTGATASQASAGSSPVHEIGVYFKRGNDWVDLEPEVVNFKTGGVLKSIATDGIVKGDVNGNIKGPASKTRIDTPVEILIYAPEGVASTEYQLLLLRVSGNAREFRTVTGGVFHKSGGASRDAIEFDAKKIASRTYSLSLSKLRPGEYGLLPPSSGDATGSSGRLGKLYTFSVKE
jgi:hypothetical protein